MLVQVAHKSIAARGPEAAAAMQLHTHAKTNGRARRSVCQKLVGSIPPLPSIQVVGTTAIDWLDLPGLDGRSTGKMRPQRRLGEKCDTSWWSGKHASVQRLHCRHDSYDIRQREERHYALPDVIRQRHPAEIAVQLCMASEAEARREVPCKTGTRSHRSLSTVVPLRIKCRSSANALQE